MAFEDDVRRHIKNRAEEIVRRWLELLEHRLDEHPRDIFPGPTLLNRIPGVIRRLAAATTGEVEEVDSTFVRKELSRLAGLRRSQGFDLSEILIEYELLRDVVFEVVLEAAESDAEPIPPDLTLRVPCCRKCDSLAPRNPRSSPNPRSVAFP